MEETSRFVEGGDFFVFAGHTKALVSFQGLVAKVRRSIVHGENAGLDGGRMSPSSELSTVCG